MDASPVRRHQLDALADPTRRAILELLRDRPLTAGEIAARFSQQRPAISKHLTLLRTTGWLAESRDRQRRIYSLRNDAVVVVVDWARRLGEGRQCHLPQAEEVAGGVPIDGGTHVANGLTIDKSVREAAVVGSTRESEISDLRIQMAEVGLDTAQPGKPCTAGKPARSSFELIFD